MVKQKDRSTASKPSNGLCMVEPGQNFCARVCCMCSTFATEIEEEPLADGQPLFGRYKTMRGVAL